MITRFASWVKIFTIPAPEERQALPARSAAPHIFLCPATMTIFPKVPLFPEESLSGSRSRILSPDIVNIPGIFSKEREVIPICAR